MCIYGVENTGNFKSFCTENQLILCHYINKEIDDQSYFVLEPILVKCRYNQRETVFKRDAKFI